MLRRIHDPERGASFTEYAGVLVLAAAIVAVLAFSGIAARVAETVDSAVAAILGGDPMDAPEGDGTTPSGGGGVTPDGSGEGAGQPGTPDSPPENAPADGTGSDEGTIVPTGGGGSGPTAADQNTGGGLLDTISQGLKDVGTGIWDAGADFVTGIKDDAVGLWEGAKKLWNDPGQWFSDAKDSIVEGAKNTWNQVTTDPGGFFLDLLVSDEVQEDWKNGDKTHAVAQGIAENLIGLIPGVGWYKKGNRALNVMGGKDRGSETTPGPVRADGDQPGDNRRSDDETTRPPARPCRGNSFVPGTLVLLADGTYAPIETITVGDDVWAFDPRTGTEGPRTVTDLHTSHSTTTLVELTVDDGTEHGGVVVATDAHPFWVPSLATWVAAIDLEPGTWLRTSAGTWVQVRAVAVRTAEAQRVHNLTVADLHTYYVAAGAADALVRNEAGCIDKSHLIEVEAGPEAAQEWRKRWEEQGQALSHRRNVAVADIRIDGFNAGQLVSVSGQNGRPGTVELPANPRYTPKPDINRDGSVGNTREYETERKILEHVAQQLNPRNPDGSITAPRTDITGEIHLYTELPPCHSCGRAPSGDDPGGIIEQFKREFPNIDVKVTYGDGQTYP